jgi:hypothetical protein
MTKEEIIEMARQSGAMFDHMTWVERDLLPVFERFAKLVAEMEREKCARLADEWVLAYPHPSKTIAESIRARGDNA